MYACKIKQFLADMRPHAEKLVVDTARGYAFGCVFGAFVPSRKPLGCAMHENGKNFAKMAVAYSATEMAIQKIRQKDDCYNSIAAGAMAGALGSQHGRATGLCMFGVYSGISYIFNKN